MKEVAATIQKIVDEMVEKNLIFKFLNDESLPATERLARIAPALSYFVLGFRDLQKYILTYPKDEAKVNRFKKAINAHCIEDSTHWPWFLMDLKSLGLDKDTSFTNAIKYLWGNETTEQRVAIYQFASLATQAIDPILRFVLMLSIEINGHAIFSKFLELADASEIETGKEIFYFGRTHVTRETGGLHGQEDVEKELMELILDEKMKAKALDIAKQGLLIQDIEWNGLGKAAYSNKKW